MDVESRDSVSLKPAELDELGLLVSEIGLPLQDEQLDGHVEQFPLVAIAAIEGEPQGFLFGSLERIGGTPCILWGLGAVRRGRTARQALDEEGLGADDRRAPLVADRRQPQDPAAVPGHPGVARQRGACRDRPRERHLRRRHGLVGEQRAQGTRRRLVQSLHPIHHRARSGSA